MTTQTEEVRRNVNSALEQVRTPLLAALGAGNIAGHAVLDAVNKTKERVTASTEAARKNIEDLPNEVENLREKFEPTELRKAFDEYADAAIRLYNKMAESGEQAWDNIVAQPQVKRALEQFEDAYQNVQDRIESVTGDARERVGDVLDKVTRRTRSGGEQAARKVREVASDVADRVEETGEELADETRSASRKAASKTAPRSTSNTTRRSTTTSTTSTAKKPTDGGSRPTGK